MGDRGLASDAFRDSNSKWDIGGVAEDVEIAFGGASGLGDMTASGGEIKGH